MNAYSRLLCLTLPGYPRPDIAIAAGRAGALGVLDLEYTRDADGALNALADLAHRGKGERGVKIDPANEDVSPIVLRRLPHEIGTVIIARPCLDSLADQIRIQQR